MVERMSILKQDHNAYDNLSVIETVIGGDADLYRVFKLSPSIMDAVSMLFTPLNQFEQRMLPPYEVLLHCVQSAFNDGTSLQEDLSINGMLNNLPFVGATLQRLGINGDGSTKPNNVFKRTEDDGVWQAVSSLFTAAYVPHKKYNTWYGADNQYLTQLPQYEYTKSPYYYSRLGGVKITPLVGISRFTHKFTSIFVDF